MFQTSLHPLFRSFLVHCQFQTFCMLLDAATTFTLFPKYAVCNSWQTLFLPFNVVVGYYDKEGLIGKFSSERGRTLDKAIEDRSDDTFDDTIWQDTRYNLIHLNRRQWNEMSDPLSNLHPSCLQPIKQSGHKQPKSNCYSISTSCCHFHCCDKFIPNQIRIIILCHQQHVVMCGSS